MIKSTADSLRGRFVLYRERRHMRMLTDPQRLSEGKKWLSLLQQESCPNFRVYVGYIRDQLHKGSYTEEELGASEEEVLKLGIKHAGEATLRGGYPLDMFIKNELQCMLTKVQGAHRPPTYAHLVLVPSSEGGDLRKAA